MKENLEFLDTNNINYLLDTKLVRGLDYYTRTVFEMFLTKRANRDWHWRLEDDTIRWRKY